MCLYRPCDAFESTINNRLKQDACGDEFGILVRDRSARQQAVTIANACCKVLEDAISCGPMEFYATPSIGIATYPQDGNDVETLLKHADTARYHAKGAGGPSVTLYVQSMSRRIRDLLDLEMRLRRALRDNALGVCLQPKFRLADNSIAGVEALARWYDPELGDIPSLRFIQCAEESGLIVDVGAWMMRTACRQVRDWLDHGISMPIAINISGKELLFADPARTLEAELTSHGVPPSLIEIELTESVFVADSSIGRKSIQRLRALGCRIALDDFGTGYSSLAYLTRFPPDRLKIDGSFVRSVDHSASDAGIVDAIMSLARTLGLVVTAEGVERRGQLEWLISRGCHEAQGYLFSGPVSAQVLEERYLRAHTRHALHLPSAASSKAS